MSSWADILAKSSALEAERKERRQNALRPSVPGGPPPSGVNFYNLKEGKTYIMPEISGSARFQRGTRITSDGASAAFERERVSLLPQVDKPFTVESIVHEYVITTNLVMLKFYYFESKTLFKEVEAKEATAVSAETGANLEAVPPDPLPEQPVLQSGPYTFTIENAHEWYKFKHLSQEAADIRRAVAFIEALKMCAGGVSGNYIESHTRNLAYADTVANPSVLRYKWAFLREGKELVGTMFFDDKRPAKNEVELIFICVKSTGRGEGRGRIITKLFEESLMKRRLQLKEDPALSAEDKARLETPLRIVLESVPDALDFHKKMGYTAIEPPRHPDLVLAEKHIPVSAGGRRKTLRQSKKLTSKFRANKHKSSRNKRDRPKRI